MGGESCDVDVPLSAKADNLLKSNSSDKCSVCMCVCARVSANEYAYMLYVLECVCVAPRVGVSPLFVGVFFDLNISKEGCACGTATGSKANRPN